MGCCATFPTHARPSRPVPDRRARLHHSFIYSSLLPVTCHRFDTTHFHSLRTSRPFSLLGIQYPARNVRGCRPFAPSRRHLRCRAAAGPCVHAAQSISVARSSRGAEQLPFMAIPGHTYEGSGAALEAGGRQPEPGIKLVRPYAHQRATKHGLAQALKPKLS